MGMKRSIWSFSVGNLAGTVQTTGLDAQVSCEN